MTNYITQRAIELAKELEVYNDGANINDLIEFLNEIANHDIRPVESDLPEAIRREFKSVELIFNARLEYMDKVFQKIDEARKNGDIMENLINDLDAKECRLVEESDVMIEAFEDLEVQVKHAINSF